jgi:hypothetical protein
MYLGMFPLVYSGIGKLDTAPVETSITFNPWFRFNAHILPSLSNTA